MVDKLERKIFPTTIGPNNLKNFKTEPKSRYDSEHSINSSAKYFEQSRFDKWINVLLCRCDLTSEKFETAPVSFLGLFRFATKFDRIYIFFGIFLAFLVGAVMPISFYINGKISEILIFYHQVDINRQSELMKEGFFFVVLSGSIGFVLIFFSFLQYFFLNLACIKITQTLKMKFVQSILRQNANFFDKRKFGAINAQLNTNIEKISDGIGDKIGVLFRGVASFVSSSLVAFFVNWRISLIIFAVGPICAFIMTSMARAINSATIKHLKAMEFADAILQESLMNVQTIQSCNGEPTMIKKYEEKLKQGRVYAILQYIWNGTFDGLFFFALYVFTGFGYYFGSWWYIDGLATASDVLIVTNLIIMGAYYLGAMSPYTMSILKARAAASIIYAQIDRLPGRIDPFAEDGVKLKTQDCEISFENVTFFYSGKSIPILDNLSWDAKSGESVALVGHSGSGKSTCMSLLTRLYECSTGCVTINGINVNDFNVHSLRKSIGIVQQEPVLFNATIFDNVSFGNKKVSINEVENACRIANAHEFITHLQEGYYTQIGAGHVHLSGGQKQRIAIARAILKNPPILLLDEATSALDAESEIFVQNALQSASRGRTTIIIAHRLSTLRNVDKIVVFNQGKVIEIGTHEELTTNNPDGHYARLVASQQFTSVTSESSVNNDQDNITLVNAGEKERSQKSLAYLRDTKSSFYLSEDTSSTDDEKDPSAINYKLANVCDNNVLIDEHKKTKTYSIFNVYLNAKNNYSTLLLGIVFSIIRGLELPAYIILMAWLFVTFQEYEKNHNLENFRINQYKLLVGNFFTAIICGIVLACGEIFLGWTAEKVVDKIRINALTNVLKQGGAFFDKINTSRPKLIRRITTDSVAIKATLDFRFFQAIHNFMALITLTAMSFFFAWKIALVGCVILILLSVLPTYLNLKVQRKVSQNNSIDDSAKTAVEIIENVKTIQLLTKEKYFIEKYLQQLLFLKPIVVKTAIFEAIIFALTQSFFFISDCLCFGMALISIYYGFNTPSDVFIASMSMGSTSFAVLFLSNALTDTLRAKPSVDSLFQLINAKSSVAQGALQEFDKACVEVNQVSFAYPTRPNQNVAENLSLKLNNKESIAFVGPSGSGKSTIISLLQRFYTPTRGTIKIDNVNIEDYDLHKFRDQIALVGQEPVLFSGSIFDNVRLGVEDSTTLEDVVNACEMANAKSFIEKLPLGYQTEVGEKGSKLSGGQKQRIAIARALIRKPKILLLDEATSALDAYSERVVQQALKIAQNGRSCITIAHRLSSIQYADKIFFIRNGRVIESGGYADLIQNPYSAFAQLVKKQELK